MLDERENNLFSSYIHLHKGLTYNTPFRLRQKKKEMIEDMFFSYWIRLSDWEMYALLEMLEGNNRGSTYDAEYWGTSMDKDWLGYYRRYRKVKGDYLQQWMVDDLKVILLRSGEWSWKCWDSGNDRHWRNIVPTLYEKYFIVGTYEKTLKASKEQQTMFHNRGLVRKKGYRWDFYFSERIVRKFLNVIVAVDNDNRKEEGLEPIEVDWLVDEKVGVDEDGYKYRQIIGEYLPNGLRDWTVEDIHYRIGEDWLDKDKYYWKRNVRVTPSVDKQKRRYVRRKRRRFTLRR